MRCISIARSLYFRIFSAYYYYNILSNSSRNRKEGYSMNNFQVILSHILRVVLPVNLCNHKFLGDVV